MPPLALASFNKLLILFNDGAYISFNALGALANSDSSFTFNIFKFPKSIFTLPAASKAAS